MLNEVGSKWVRWANGVGTTLAVCGEKLVCSIFGLTILFHLEHKNVQFPRLYSWSVRSG